MAAVVVVMAVMVAVAVVVALAVFSLQHWCIHCACLEYRNSGHEKLESDTVEVHYCVATVQGKFVSFKRNINFK